MQAVKEVEIADTVRKLGALKCAFKFALEVLFGKVDAYAFIYTDNLEVRWEHQTAKDTQVKLRYGLQHLLGELGKRNFMESGIKSGNFNPSPFMLDGMEHDRLELLQTYIDREIKKLDAASRLSKQKDNKGKRGGTIPGDTGTD